MEGYTTLKVKSIKKIEKRKKVYNLSCEPHSYYHANGILNHNCDSKYSWKDGKYVTTQSIVDYIKKEKPNGLIITGGEPLLQSVEIYKLITELPTDLPIEIETNGTIPPLKELMAQTNVSFNVSPKLSNSGNAIEKRINIGILNLFNSTRSIYKFVISNKNDLKEIEAIIKPIAIKPGKIYLMPEGITAAEQAKKQEYVIKFALERGWNFSPRLQVIVWDKKRGV